jgi:hypothetical protein
MTKSATAAKARTAPGACREIGCISGAQRSPLSPGLRQTPDRTPRAGRASADHLAH